jgi:hypothetical protein
VATGPFGGVAGGRFGGVAGGPGGVRVGGGRAIAAGRGTRFVSPAVIRTQAASVRAGFYRGVFSAGWFQVHRTSWPPLRWRVPNFWVAPAWTNVALYVGISAPPVVYNFGSNVIIVNNQVYVNGSQVGSADQFAQQAAQFAAAGRAAQPAAQEEWQPLGVFGLVAEEDQTSQHIFQLAINQNGIVRGNFHDVVSDMTLPVFGALDRRTQRVAWSIGDQKNIVFEAGFKNLTENEVPVLEHYGTEYTQQLLLIRLDAPHDTSK